MHRALLIVQLILIAEMQINHFIQKWSTRNFLYNIYT